MAPFLKISGYCKMPTPTTTGLYKSPIFVLFDLRKTGIPGGRDMTLVFFYIALVLQEYDREIVYFTQ